MKVVAIHIAPGSRLPARPVDSVDAEARKGLLGDRYHGSRHRQVTLQSRESLDLAAADLGLEFDSHATRRNITVDRGEIPATPGVRLRIGEAEFEVEILCKPYNIRDVAELIGRLLGRNPG